MSNGVHGIGYPVKWKEQVSNGVHGIGYPV